MVSIRENLQPKKSCSQFNEKEISKEFCNPTEAIKQMKPCKKICICSEAIYEEFINFQQFPIKSLSFKPISGETMWGQENDRFLNKIFHEKNIYHNNFINNILGKGIKYEAGIIQYTYNYDWFYSE